ncbi:uncharacterized protein LOC142777416 [Rhipicephalus microplus]|uniref:uncharacterized protein LOC142777416 n=1 Tax=Rhipicephalus microplus TaxID=6941 RepID=UPI003F6D0F8C
MRCLDFVSSNRGPPCILAIDLRCKCAPCRRVTSWPTACNTVLGPPATGSISCWFHRLLVPTPAGTASYWSYQLLLRLLCSSSPRDMDGSGPDEFLQSQHYGE